MNIRKSVRNLAFDVYNNGGVWNCYIEELIKLHAAQLGITPQELTAKVQEEVQRL